MARVELSPSRVRARRRQQRIRLALLGVAGLVIIIGALAGLTWLPFLRINTIDVSGTQTLSPSDITAFVSQEISGAYFHIFAKNNIFLYPKSAIITGLEKQLPTIAQAQVGAKNFHTIGVTILERQPKALWCGEQVASSTSLFPGTSECWLMDQDGIVYAPSATTTGYDQYFGALASSASPQVYVPAEQFQSLSALVDAVAQKVSGDSVQSIYINDNKDVYLTFGSGFELIFALSDDGGDMYQRFVLALQSDPFKSNPLSDFEYLDLRFGDKLYYKLKN